MVGTPLLWLPDAKLLRLWLWAIAACTAVWAVVQFPLLVKVHGASVPTLGVGVVGSAPLGIAYGSFVSALVVAARSVFKLFGEKVPLEVSPGRAARVAAVMYGVHLVCLGLLWLLGMWSQSSPWFFGLAPMLWS